MLSRLVGGGIEEVRGSRGAVGEQCRSDGPIGEGQRDRTEVGSGGSLTAGGDDLVHDDVPAIPGFVATARRRRVGNVGDVDGGTGCDVHGRHRLGNDQGDEYEHGADRHERHPCGGSGTAPPLADRSSVRRCPGGCLRVWNFLHLGTSWPRPWLDCQSGMGPPRMHGSMTMIRSARPDPQGMGASGSTVGRGEAAPNAAAVTGCCRPREAAGEVLCQCRSRRAVSC